VTMEGVWSSLLAFFSGVPVRVNKVREWRRSSVLCTLESSGQGGSSSFRRLDESSMRHIAAQFLVDGTRESKRPTRTEEGSQFAKQNQLVVGKEEIANMQSQSLFEWPELASFVPALVQRLKRQREAGKEENEDKFDLESVLPAPLFQSISFTWEEQPDAEEKSFVEKVFDIHRNVIEGVEDKYKKLVALGINILSSFKS